jgi:hypothetical protein
MMRKIGKGDSYVTGPVVDLNEKKKKETKESKENKNRKADK